MKQLKAIILTALVGVVSGALFVWQILRSKMTTRSEVKRMEKEAKRTDEKAKRRIRESEARASADTLRDRIKAEEKRNATDTSLSAVHDRLDRESRIRRSNR